MTFTISPWVLLGIVAINVAVIVALAFWGMYHKATSKALYKVNFEYAKRFLEATIMWFEATVLIHKHDDENYKKGYFVINSYRFYFDVASNDITMITLDQDMEMSPIYYQNGRFLSKWYDSDIYEHIQKSFYDEALIFGQQTIEHRKENTT